MPNDYAIYLRKSRVDQEAEQHGQGDTLQRHRSRLLEISRQRGLTITKIYEEVVSGETITSRPEMQKLLRDVESGKYTGVLVMEIERLARGDTIDQGVVARTFQFSQTKIVTPAKTYDPNNEFDQEYFEFGLYMSRREYKTINRRQQAGRLASVAEGKWPANKSPYGYRRVKLETQKGWTLEPDEHAKTVENIFQWYTQGALCEDGIVRRIGVSIIVRRLNDAYIPSPAGKDWTNSAIQSMLRNPAYAGWVRWGDRATVKRIQDGEIVFSNPRKKPGDASVKMCKGLHVAIVTQETFDLAQKILQYNPGRPGPKFCVTMNPLSGLIRCDQCGRMMVRRPYGNGHKDTLLCAYTSCHTVSSDLDIVESLVLQGMKQFLSEFEQTPLEQDTAIEGTERAEIIASLTALYKELEQIDAQEAKAFDLVEQGVYTIDIFTQRTSVLSQRRQTVNEQISSLQDSISSLDSLIQAKQEIAPAFRNVLDNYDISHSPEEKNRLLRSVLDHVDYHKTIGSRWQESDLKIQIAPKLPY